jgi:exodeoxyribonuclease VII small subunit
MTKKKSDIPVTDPGQEDLKFEAALEELETLVAQMESGDLSLDESLKAFERGVALTRHCSTALKQAELKVQALNEEGELVDFDTDDFDDT